MGVMDAGAFKARADKSAGEKMPFLQCGGAQCGICTPGMLMASAQLLARNPHPALPEIREALAGNLCRCTGYMRIFESVVAAAMAHKAELAETPDAR